MTDKIKSWFRDGVSMDETRVSSLVLIFVITSLFALGMYYLHGDFSDNLLILGQTLIYSVAGVNVANGIKSAVAEYKKNDNNKGDFSDRI
jgi:hypothetical protein